MARQLGAESLRDRVLRHLRRQGDDGATAPEMALALGAGTSTAVFHQCCILEAEGRVRRSEGRKVRWWYVERVEA